MTSAAFAMPDDGRKISIRRRATNASTATAQVADEALQYVLDRRLRKRDGRAPPPMRQGQAGPPALAPASAVAQRPQWLLRVAVLAGVALVIGAAVLKLSRGGDSSHSVAGTVLLGKAPLAMATISFHRTPEESSFEPVSVTTGQDGGFRSPEERPLPAGLYAVVVDTSAAGRQSRTAGIPAVYRDPATTPLRVLVSEDLSGLRFLIRK